MNWLHPGILTALVLVLAPVALHLLLRARPKPLAFPALRLIQARKTMNRRRMRLRHWWLLLLRMLVVAFIVMAVARPTLPPANYALSRREWLVGAAILAVAAIAYWGTLAMWRRGGLARHRLLTRQTSLRAAVGIGTVVLLLLLVAWPYQQRVAAEISSPATPQAANVPVAAVFLLDVSRRMEYRHEGSTRLEAAIKLASEQLGRLPQGSRAAVLATTKRVPQVFSSDLTAVLDQLSSVAPTDEPVVLNDMLQTALEAQRDDRERTLEEQGSLPEAARQDRFVREVYLFTDLSRSAWRIGGESPLRSQLEAFEGLSVYVVDVGVERPINAGFGGIRLERENVAVGSRVRLEATVRREGPSAAPLFAELWLNDASGTPVKAGQSEVPTTESGQTAVGFEIEARQIPGVSGELRLSQTDPLPADNTAVFALGVHPPARVLLVGDSAGDVSLFRRAIAPQELVKSGRARYQVDFSTVAAAGRGNLGQYATVVLMNAVSPGGTLWENLAAYVENGGGLLVVAGKTSRLTTEGGTSGIDPLAYRSAAALSVLPASLKASLKVPAGTTMDWTATDHPLVRNLEAYGALAIFAGLDIARLWTVSPHPEARVVASYTGNESSPALLERSIGRGRVFLLTTALGDPAWNDLPRSWMYVVLSDLMLQTLSRTAQERHNFLMGEALAVDVASATGPREFFLRRPDFVQQPLSLSAGETRLKLPAASTPGLYELTSAEDAAARQWLAVNRGPEAGNLTKVTSTELDEVLGPERYSIDRDLAMLERRLNVGRLGQEVYGLLVTVLAVFFLLEQATATWFYRQEESNTSPTAA